MLRGLVRHDGDDVRIVLAERRAAGGRAADLDLRVEPRSGIPRRPRRRTRASPYSPSKKTDRAGRSWAPARARARVRSRRFPWPPVHRASPPRDEDRGLGARRLVALRVLAVGVRLVLVVRVLEGADSQPVLHERLDELHGDRRLAGFVRADDEEDDRGFSSNGIEQMRPARAPRNAPRRSAKARDPGVQARAFAPRAAGTSPCRSGGRSPGRRRGTRTSPSASESGPDRGRGRPSAGAGTPRRAGTRRGPSRAPARRRRSFPRASGTWA